MERERERGAGVGTRARGWDMEWKMEEINSVTPQIWGWFAVVCGISTDRLLKQNVRLFYAPIFRRGYQFPYFLKITL